MGRFFLAIPVLVFAVFLQGCSIFRPHVPDDEFTVTDIDGNVYRTVLIGDQVWMAENLRVTRYRDGSRIQGNIAGGDWYNTTEGAYSIYDDDMRSDEIYGKLYNWYAVADERGLCPEGWHVPTDAEWKQLEIYLGLTPEEADEYGARGTDEGGKLKKSGTQYWNSPNEGATGETGFAALPGGYVGGFYFIGLFGSWWTSTEVHDMNAWSRLLDHYTAKIYRLSNNKKEGFSVRCIKD